MQKCKEVIIVNVGPFSAGKTKTLNNLFTLDLPSGILPTTKAFTEVTFGKTRKVIAYSKDGINEEEKTEDIENLGEFFEKLNKKEKVSRIEVQHPNIPNDLKIVDSIGYQAEKDTEEVLYRYLTKANIGFIFVPAVPSFTINDIEVIKNVLEHFGSKNIVIIITKVDLLENNNQKEQL